MGGKSSAPAAPDYVGQAQATATGNLSAARSTTAANRVDQVTPYGSINYTQGDGFDQAGYNDALSRYQSQQAQIQQNAGLKDYYGKTGQLLTAPTQDQFTTNPDHWASQINLSPTGQALLDQYNQSSLQMGALQGQAATNVANAMGPLDTSQLTPINSTTGMDGWDRATQLIMQRQNPQLDQQQNALNTQLANQGLTPGSEGWQIQQTQFGKSRNDANIAANLAGSQVQNQMFNQAMQGNQANLAQQNFLQTQPINILNALRSGSQVTNPTFSTPGQQSQTSGPDLLGASNSQYNAALGQTNAQNAQAAQTTSAGVGLAGTAATIAMMY